MVKRAAAVAKIGIKAHAQRHACGFKLADDGNRHPIAAGVPRAQQYPEYGPIYGVGVGAVQRTSGGLTSYPWVVVLVCYLDESGKDPQNPITTLAGYAATEDQWRGFETEVEPIFADCGVKVLHTKDLHKTDGEFDGWRLLQKQAFVARICCALSHHVPLGMSASAAKEIYAQRAAESGRKRTITPYAWCFNLIVQWILTDIRVGRLAHTEGVSFILETGHENNPEAEKVFNDVRRLYGDAVAP